MDGRIVLYHWSFGDGGAIQSWIWDFGDGNVGTGRTPTHAYLTAGTYTVLLTVTDDEGQVSAEAMTTATIDVRPGNQAPTADARGPYTGFVGDTVAFDGTGSSDADDDRDHRSAIVRFRR